MNIGLQEFVQASIVFDHHGGVEILVKTLFKRCGIVIVKRQPLQSTSPVFDMVPCKLNIINLEEMIFNEWGKLR
jgi:hypothetical protein